MNKPSHGLGMQRENQIAQQERISDNWVEQSRHLQYLLGEKSATSFVARVGVYNGSEIHTWYIHHVAVFAFLLFSFIFFYFCCYYSPRRLGRRMPLKVALGESHRGDRAEGCIKGAMVEA